MDLFGEALLRSIWRAQEVVGRSIQAEGRGHYSSSAMHALLSISCPNDGRGLIPWTDLAHSSNLVSGWCRGVPFRERNSASLFFGAKPEAISVDSYSLALGEAFVQLGKSISMTIEREPGGSPRNAEKVPRQRTHVREADLQFRFRRLEHSETGGGELACRQLQVPAGFLWRTLRQAKKTANLGKFRATGLLRDEPTPFLQHSADFLRDECFVPIDDESKRLVPEREQSLAIRTPLTGVVDRARGPDDLNPKRS